MSSTASCSIAVVTTCRRAGFPRAAPRIARFSASVAPDVNTISFGLAPMSAATAPRAASRASAASRP